MICIVIIFCEAFTLVFIKLFTHLMEQIVIYTVMIHNFKKAVDCKE